MIPTDDDYVRAFKAYQRQIAHGFIFATVALLAVLGGVGWAVFTLVSWVISK